MATVTKRLYTPEDVLRITDRPNPDLVDGRLEERELKGQKADQATMRVAYITGCHAEKTSSGYVNGANAGYQIFPDDVDKVRYSDISYTRADRLPNGPAEGHSQVSPDLVVEVLSPYDLAAKLRRKIRDFLDAGVPLIWVANPETRDVQVIRADGTGILLTESQMLDGGDVLPGFSCPVASLFG